MKKIFVYFSETGNGDIVADYLKDKGYEIRKVEAKKKLPKVMFFQMMVGGFQAATGKRPKLKEFDTNIDKYDEVIIGSPIWFDRLAAPTNTMLDKLDLSNKKVSFILYSGGGTNINGNKQINELFKDAKIVELKQPKHHKEELDKLKELI